LRAENKGGASEALGGARKVFFCEKNIARERLFSRFTHETLVLL
jgi:hypothetical protein